MGYVSVPVPEERVQEVYELLASPPVTPATPTDNSGFSSVEIHRMWKESGARMQAVLAQLADHPDEEFTAVEMTKILGVTTDQFRGVMGAFGHRVKARYGWTNWPFNRRWDDQQSTAVYLMSSKVAAVMNAAR
jgi:hypothetical protein